MKEAILTLLVVFAFLFLLRNVFGFFKIMLSAKRPAERLDQIINRIKGIFVYVLGQKRILKNYTWAGVEHFMLFWGFMIITFGSLEVLIIN